jgi:hypothetical protein
LPPTLQHISYHMNGIAIDDKLLLKADLSIRECSECRLKACGAILGQ